MLKGLFRERRRSRAVKDLGILNTPAELNFDRLVEQAASAFAAPIALLSLIHDDTQWFKAVHGADITCIPRDAGFCSFALDRPDLLETCAPDEDPRFAALPGVCGDPHVRYYIGAPLRLLNGVDVGALCVVDVVRRAPASEDQRAYLLGLARQAVIALETRSDLLRERAAA